jgi:hypothetical protein
VRGIGLLRRSLIVRSVGVMGWVGFGEGSFFELGGFNFEFGQKIWA